MVRSRSRVVAAAALAVALAFSSAPVGAVARTDIAKLRPAVLDRTLAGKLLKAKPTHVFETIVSVWDRGTLRQLDKMRVAHRKMRVLPMAFAKLTPLQISRLLGIRGVRSIYAPRTFRPMLSEAAAIIGARAVTDSMKVDGTGVTVAVIDTGVDALHPDLPYGDKVIANYEVVSPGIFDPASPIVVDMPNTDDDGHGTHVSGTIAGTGAGSPDRDLRGVAPGAKLIAYSANQGLTLLESHTTAAFDDILAKRKETGVRAVSNSWGGGDGFNFDPDDPTSIAQETAFKLGVLPVFAAGNGGNPGDTTIDGINTLSMQCASPYVVCVGAVTKHRQVVTFSSIGRPGTNHERNVAERYRIGMYRPTITAPGVNISAPAAAAATPDAESPYGYMSISGTSMSTPVVTGVVALMAQANPRLTPRQMIQILEGTADPQPGWDAHQQGAGMVNAKRAVEAALATKAGGPLSLPKSRLDYTPPARARKQLAAITGSAIPASWVHKQGVETHTFNVPAGVERFEMTLSWPTPAENLYAFLWAPGDTPNDATPNGAPFPTQESWGLLCDGASPVQPCTLPGRKALVAYPEPGLWTLRVYARTLATDYEAKIDALTYTLPSIDASVVAGRLTGTATFPGVEPTPRVLEMVPGVTMQNPTLKPKTVYFHGTAPVGNLDRLGGTDPSWSAEAPTGSQAKMNSGLMLANGDSAGNPIVAGFSSTLDRAIEGTVEVVFWGSATTALSTWAVSLLAPDGEGGHAVVGSGDVLVVHVPGAPVRVVAFVREVRLPAGTPLTVQISNILAPTFAVHYDSVTMPSGMILPEVAKLTSNRVADLGISALQAEDLRNGSVKLVWPRVPAATGYRIYQGSDPDRLSPVGTVGAISGGKKEATETVTGSILVGNPATQSGLAGVVNTEFQLTCSPDVASNGLDGVVIQLKEGAGDGLQTFAVKGTGAIWDLDVYMYDEGCALLDAPDLATQEPDETGKIPEGAAYAIVNLWAGADVGFEATYTVAGDKASTMIRGLRPGTPHFFRVAALTEGKAEGELSDMVVVRPTALERVVEVSVDGINWAPAQTVNGTAKRATFSVPASTAAASAASMAKSSAAKTLWVRARAGDAVSKPTQVKVAAGGVATGPRVLPATGVGSGIWGLGLVLAAVAILMWRRRARTV